MTATPRIDPATAKTPGNTAMAKRRRSAASTDEYGLTTKQRRFCDHVIADPDQNRRHAFKAAGYKFKSWQMADRNIWAMWKLPHIQSYIKMRRRALRKSTNINQQKIVKELARIGFLDPADLFDDFGALRHIQEVPVSARKAIAQIDVFTEYSGRGEDKEVIGHTTRIKFVDKKGALDSIARILGCFQQDKIDTDGVAKLMEIIGEARGGSTIGRLNSAVDRSSGPLLGPVVATQQLVSDPGQGGERGPLPAQLGANGTAGKLLVHERDPEGAAVGDDDVHRHPATG